MTENEQLIQRDLRLLKDKHLKRRLSQIIWAVALGLTTLAISNLMFDASLWTTVALAITLGMVLLSHLLLRSNHLLPSSYLLLFTGTVVCMALMWHNNGLRDTSLLAFPAILFFAAVLGNRRLFYSLFVPILLFLVLVGVSDIMGWAAFRVRPLAWDNIVDVTVLLGLAGFSMRLLSEDMRKVMNELKLENTRTRLAEQEARYRAHHDGLTGLPNRVVGEDRFRQALLHAGRNGENAALLFVDLDHFKTFNDSLGHSFGDQLICEVGRRLQSAVRESDTVCRHGGDEFIVILDTVPDARVAERCAMDLLEAIAEPLELLGYTLELSASIGLAMVPGDGSDYEEVCGKADMAMYRAKEIGRNTVRFFDEAMNQQADERLQMVAGLRQAIRNDEFYLVFQPQVELQSGRVVGAEALLRWDRPGHGTVLPDDFIPLAEETSMILEIGHWVLRQACHQGQRWHDLGYEDLTISVNVSPVQISRDGFESAVASALQESGLAPGKLELELIESQLIDSDTTLEKIRNLGVGFAIDDFGTGYSNLAYLGRFHAQSVKIDRSFVINSVDVEQDLTILSAIVQLGRNLGLKVIAEGIETEQSRSQLLELKCEVGQGYYWSRPLRVDAFLEYLVERETVASLR